MKTLFLPSADEDGLYRGGVFVQDSRLLHRFCADGVDVFVLPPSPYLPSVHHTQSVLRTTHKHCWCLFGIVQIRNKLMAKIVSNNRWFLLEAYRPLLRHLVSDVIICRRRVLRKNEEKKLRRFCTKLRRQKLFHQHSAAILDGTGVQDPLSGVDQSYPSRSERDPNPGYLVDRWKGRKQWVQQCVWGGAGAQQHVTGAVLTCRRVLDAADEWLFCLLGVHVQPEQ